MFTINKQHNKSKIAKKSQFDLHHALKNGHLEEAQLLIALGIRTRAQWINEPDFLLTSPYLEATWELCVNNLCEEDQQKNGCVVSVNM